MLPEQSGSQARAADRPLRRHRPHRQGRHGHGLPRPRRGPGARGGGEDPHRRGHASTTESRRRFEIEAKAAAKLQHPNIVTVFELGEDRGVPYIAMEMLPGVDLEALLRSGEELLLAEKLDIVIQVGRGPRLRPRAQDRPPRHQAQQHPAPRRRHREDHGLRHRQARGHPPHQDGDDGGHRPLHEPRAGAGPGASTGAATSSPLGVILYELLAGQRPFKGEGATDVLYKIVHEEPGAPRPRRPRRARPAAARGRERGPWPRRPDERYPTAAALADDLASVLDAHQRARRARPRRRPRCGGGRGGAAPGEGRARRRRACAACASSQQANPHSLEARRALRTALREKTRREKPPGAGGRRRFRSWRPPSRPRPRGAPPETLLQPTVVLTPRRGRACPSRSAPAARLLHRPPRRRCWPSLPRPVPPPQAGAGRPRGRPGPRALAAHGCRRPAGRQGDGGRHERRAGRARARAPAGRSSPSARTATRTRRARSSCPSPRREAVSVALLAASDHPSP